ncbi:cyclic nucleotide-gated channel 17 [Actinidia rufa]|uniref:Cyclic nucleotide-gated channel 17 n=1 Tax=Actinidia rufa TaxID=165716 RepID=A0A7J0EXI3_9ERIC|nr:cyclic nucleotide-gated channel 17 [Actinidia rufa]
MQYMKSLVNSPPIGEVSASPRTQPQGLILGLAGACQLQPLARLCLVNLQSTYQWGLHMKVGKARSSYGQNLSTSPFIGETLFAILIAILGLVLFAHLIGNMQGLGHAWANTCESLFLGLSCNYCN